MLFKLNRLNSPDCLSVVVMSVGGGSLTGCYILLHKLSWRASLPVLVVVVMAEQCLVIIKVGNHV